MSNTCLSRQILVATTNMILSRQKFCYYILLSRQIFVVTDTCLSRQTRVCRDKTFVATKMILVAAPANDIAPGDPVPPVNKDYKYKCSYSLCHHWVSSETESDTGVPWQTQSGRTVGFRHPVPTGWKVPESKAWPQGLSRLVSRRTSAQTSRPAGQSRPTLRSSKVTPLDVTTLNVLRINSAWSIQIMRLSAAVWNCDRRPPDSSDSIGWRKMQSRPKKSGKPEPTVLFSCCIASNLALKPHWPGHTGRFRADVWCLRNMMSAYHHGLCRTEMGMAASADSPAQHDF